MVAPLTDRTLWQASMEFLHVRLLLVAIDLISAYSAVDFVLLSVLLVDMLTEGGLKIVFSAYVTSNTIL